MTQQDTARQLLQEHGQTYAEEAGIRLRDKPSPLYRLLVLTALLSVRISAALAVAAARELSRSGWRTPKAMQAATWQQRVDALGRAHYKRYDESTSTYLEQGAALVQERYAGDLRRLRAEADGDVSRLRELVTEVPRIGPTGAHIFCREVQVVWPEVRPYFDQRALDRAKALGLPADARRLAKLVGGDDVGRLAAALVRASLA